ncbi:E3 ubiquitin-protein ligase TRIM32-like [Thrips palmi]|uniref:E3 ubiquitin-protein ligase TRIM32-like n=1 Tax=Thrips palmi TaxID=161013 RepID=A0A6P9A7B6_THRPL|nr:E3 ubiquitin-protein ligase TRIM32-like [Thrips palmi]
MDDVSNCTVCLEKFDADALSPTLLVCGHTLCRRCVRDLHQRGRRVSIRCPICRKVTIASPTDLPVNFSFLALLEKVQNESEPKRKVAKWCLDCKVLAGTSCQEEHTICPLRKEQLRQLEDEREILEAAVKSTKVLECILRENVEIIPSVLHNLRYAVTKAQQDTAEALKLFKSSKDATGTEWERVRGTVQQASLRCIQSREFDKQSVDFVQGARRCEVTVIGEHGRTWRGTFTLEDDLEESSDLRLVLAMVSTMQRARLLVPVEETQGDEVVKPSIVSATQTSDSESSGSESSDAEGSDTESEEEQKEETEGSSAAGVEDGEFVPLHGQAKETQYGRAGDDDARGLFTPLDPPLTYLKVWHSHCYTSDLLKILRCHGSTLEQLTLCNVLTGVLDPVFAMPRLRTLKLKGWKGSATCLTRLRPPSNVLRLNQLTVTGFWIGPEGIAAILRVVGVARHLVLEWSVNNPASHLAAVFQDWARRAASSSPRSIKLERDSEGCRSLERCEAQCAAIRQIAPGVDVWCEVHDPNHVLTNV